MKNSKLIVGVLAMVMLFSLAFTATAETRESKASQCNGTKWKNILTLENEKVTKGKHENLVSAINQGCDFKVLSVISGNDPQSFSFTCSYVTGGILANGAKDKYFECQQALRGKVKWVDGGQTDLMFNAEEFHLELDKNNVVYTDKTYINVFNQYNKKAEGDSQELSSDRIIKIFVK